jgi:hypothetical protein
MATETQVRVLKEILRRGPWKTHSELMSERLTAYPRHFDILSKDDANRVIDYGNEVLTTAYEVSYLKSVDIAPYLINTDKPEGRCVDMWRENEHDDLDELLEETNREDGIELFVDEAETLRPLTYSDSVFFDPITEETVETTAIPDYVNYEYPTIRFDDTGLDMYELETTPEMPPTDDGKSVNERLAVFEAKETLKKRRKELESNIKDKKVLKDAVKHAKKAIGYDLAKRLATERHQRQKHECLAKMYGTTTGRIPFKRKGK